MRGREEKLRMTSAQALFAKELREKLLREKSDMGRNEIKMALKKGAERAEEDCVRGEEPRDEHGTFEKP